MKLKILSWNVQGLHAKEKRAAISSYVKSMRADIICLQEMKLEKVDRGLVWHLWGGHYVE